MYRVRFGQSGARPHPRAVLDWLRALTRAYSHTLDSSSTTSSLISYLFYRFFFFIHSSLSWELFSGQNLTLWPPQHCTSGRRPPPQHLRAAREDRPCGWNSRDAEGDRGLTSSSSKSSVFLLWGLKKVEAAGSRGPSKFS
jgi:hypothetical protein